MIIVRFIEDTDMTFRMVWAIPLANESIDTRAFVDILVWRKDFVACPALKKKIIISWSCLLGYGRRGKRKDLRVTKKLNPLRMELW